MERNKLNRVWVERKDVIIRFDYPPADDEKALLKKLGFKYSWGEWQKTVSSVEELRAVLGALSSINNLYMIYPLDYVPLTRLPEFREYYNWRGKVAYECGMNWETVEEG